MTNPKDTHTLLQTVVLHLLPGILGGIVYFVLVPFVEARGYPSVMALALAGILVLMPFEVIFLLNRRKKQQSPTGHIIAYLRPLPAWHYLVWIPVILVLSGIAFKVFGYSNEFIRPLFDGLPSLSMGMSGSYTRDKLLITYAVFLVFIVIVLPTVEELYFRGYLLPRMPEKLKGWGTLVHSALFALYHIWTPWMAITRTFGIFPLAYIVRRKQNIYLGIVAHCLLNSIDLIIAVSFFYTYFISAPG